MSGSDPGPRATPTPALDVLLDRLGDPDPRVGRRAGDELLRLGAPAVGPPAALLTEGPPEARKAAAFLLGRLAAGVGGESGVEAGGEAGVGPRAAGRTALEALMAALADDEPKVRKNAAVSLGRLAARGTAGGGTALATALAAETVPWVRTSLVLALGSVGGGVAREALERAEPASAGEAEALRKARDRVLAEGALPQPRWRDEAPPLPQLHAAVPPGLEDVACTEAVEAGWRGTAVAERGLLRLPADAPPDRLLRRLRCVHDLRLLLARVPPLHDLPRGDLAGRIAGLLRGAAWLADWRRWIDPGNGEGEGVPLRYRFALDGLRVPKAIFLAVLDAARRALEPSGLRDSPSRYALQVTVEATPEATRLWAIPTFLPDERFAYRRADVGASIDPVVAACLARLVATDGAEDGDRTLRIVDPTCGSATLLVERARLSPGVGLLGMDVSPTAVAAAGRNLEAAGLAGRATVRRADARDSRSWDELAGGEIDEVVANLPFGVRSRGTAPRQRDGASEEGGDEGLARLYDAVVAEISGRLAPRGRAVLYTANRNLFHGALRRARRGIRYVDERTTEAGGLRVGIWVLERDPH